MSLARIGHQPERPARAQLHVRDLQSVVDTTDHQALFAPVELERFTQRELQPACVLDLLKVLSYLADIALQPGQLTRYMFF